MSSPAERLPWQQLDDESTLPGLEERVTHPGFDGIQFLHVRAKSIINDVPEAAGLPFQHTINAYRGCTHACSYCLHGDTPILMADGCTKPLTDIRPGDEVYGTVHEGRYRRYVPTPVLDHWATVKSAHQVTLDDGTHLIASGDHRLLTGRGWRHVSPEGPAAWRYAGLKPGDRLVGATPDRERRLGPLDRLRVRSIEALGRELELYDITTGTGDFVADGVVSHNCFARPSHRYLELDPAEEFESVIVVKTNAVPLLRAELRRPSWSGDHIAMGTNTDPYQRCEGRYELTRGIIETLTEVGNPYSLLTKGTLPVRDLDVLTAAQERRPTAVNFSIPTFDEEVWRATEPGTPHPRRRMETLARLNDAGVPSGVMLAPVIPGMSDGREQLREVVEAAVEAGATFVRPIVLHLRSGVKEIFTGWLEEHRPDLLERYEREYRGSRAPRAVRRRICATVDDLVEAAGGTRGQADARRPGGAEDAGGTPARPRGEQLGLGV